MPYPLGTVRALLDSDHVSPATRQSLQERLDNQLGTLIFFTSDEAELLRGLVTRLLPQPDTRPTIDVIAPVDERLASNEGDGWRYDALPADADAWRQGLQLFQEAAQVTFGVPFTQLTDDQRDGIIGQFQQGKLTAGAWPPLLQQRFFEDMLAELVSRYFSHPLAQEEFGYVGMADKPRWERVGLNELAEREPKES